MGNNKSVKETKAISNQVFVPIRKKYKPIPKFNGKRPNC